MRFRFVIMGLAALLLAVSACGGGGTYHLPVDSRVKPFKKQTADELTRGNEDLTSSQGDDDDDDDDDDDMAMPPDMKNPCAGAANPKAPGSNPRAGAAKKPAGAN